MDNDLKKPENRAETQSSSPSARNVASNPLTPAQSAARYKKQKAQSGYNNLAGRQTASPLNRGQNFGAGNQYHSQGQTRRPLPSSNAQDNSISQNQSKPSTALRPSAEEKLKRSMSGLSHMGGGFGGAGLSNQKLPDKSTADARRKVGGVVLDMETIQSTQSQQYGNKGKRNNVIILVLSLLLIVSLAYLTIAVLTFNGSKRENNCFYKINGEDAYWVVEGERNTEFAVKKGLHANTIYQLNSQLQISTLEEVEIALEIKVSINGEEFLIGGLDEAHENLLPIQGTNKYVYSGSVVGGGTILLFEGIDFRDAPAKLSSTNVLIEVIATITKV